MADSLISIGCLMRPRGVRGQIKCKPYTHDLNRYKQLKRVFVFPENRETELQIESAGRLEDLWVFKFKGYETPESLAPLVNLEIQIPLSERILPPEGEYYFSDLEGFAVIAAGGDPVGKVLSVQEFPSVNAFSVALQDGRNIWIPWIDDCILGIDTDKRAVTVSISYIEELLEKGA
ncbi:MAG: ribosome maturation factor RimM [Fibrobacter sp.]|nr:ribosome maturation factor RimM [Fibrobacter sp.]